MLRGILLVALSSALLACGGGPCRPGGNGSYLKAPYATIAEYCMVDLQGGQIQPMSDVLPYDLNTPLFSDYAVKTRTVWMPGGQSATYDANTTFTFPLGTIFTKSFGFRDDFRKANPTIHWVETRVLYLASDGWHGYTYEWDAAQHSATLSYAGGVQPISWLDSTGATVTANYLVPDLNQCKQCHENSSMLAPIGPKARNLNRLHAYSDGTENQLTRWGRVGFLTGAPDPATAPLLPVWNDPQTGSTEARARAYLETNCAHCHNENGAARTTGLFLWANETNPTSFGICKPPVAAGPATGGFSFDVVPGDADHSILTYRLNATQPGIAMPIIARSVVDQEGLALVRSWIQGLSGGCP